MAKIVGFTGNVDGYKTRAGFMNSTMFFNACGIAAKILDKPMMELHTKRQAGKFRRGKGIVYDTAILKGSEE